MGILDDSTFTKFEQNEAENPCPRKILDNRTIYLSRPMPFSAGLPALSDLSEARFGNSLHTDDIMPNVYRAPEVILGIPWSYPVDIWGLGMVVRSSDPITASLPCRVNRCTERKSQIWDLFEGRPLFSAKNQDGLYSERSHISEMIAVLGPPPQELLERSSAAIRFWDRNGRHSHPLLQKFWHHTCTHVVHRGMERRSTDPQHEFRDCRASSRRRRETGFPGFHAQDATVDARGPKQLSRDLL